MEWVRYVGGLLKLYAETRNVGAAAHLHAQILRSPHRDNVFLANTLVLSYGRCGCVVDAREAFDAIVYRNAFSWNILASAYLHNGCLEEARAVLDKMPQKSAVSWNLMLSAYSRQQRSTKAKAIFDSMPELDVAAWNSLLAAYDQNGHQVDVLREVYARMPAHDVVTWNTLLAVFSESGDTGGAKPFFDGMPQRTLVSWTCLMQASGDFEGASAVFERMPLRDVVAWTAMLQAAAVPCQGDADDFPWHGLESLFRDMPQRDAAAWSLMISSYGQGGKAWEAKRAFDAMPGRLKNASCWNAVAHAFLSNGLETEARGILLRMSHRDVVSWNEMLLCCVQRGEASKAETMLRDAMPERNAVSWTTVVCGYARSRVWNHCEDANRVMDVMPCWNLVCWNVTITSLAQRSKLDAAKAVFSRLPETERDVVSWTVLLNACAVNGELNEAARLFSRGMPERNLVAWNAMAAAYARTGHTAEARAVLQLMPGHDVTSLTLLSAVAAHSGCLDEARGLFDRVTPGNDVVAWNAMIEAYAHNGQARDVLLLYREMLVQGVDPDVVTMASILAAYSRLGRVEEGKEHLARMKADHGVLPSDEHFACIVDSLGRAGQLSAAEELLENLPFAPSYVAWGSLVASCRMHQDAQRGHRAALAAAALEPCKSAPYVLVLQSS